MAFHKNMGQPPNYDLLFQNFAKHIELTDDERAAIALLANGAGKFALDALLGKP